MTKTERHLLLTSHMAIAAMYAMLTTGDDAHQQELVAHVQKLVDISHRLMSVALSTQAEEIRLGGPIADELCQIMDGMITNNKEGMH